MRTEGVVGATSYIRYTRAFARTSMYSKSIITAVSVLLLSTLCASAMAATRYINDEHFVPLRSGPGGEFRIVHRGLPTGTLLSVLATSENQEFTQVTTANGTEGWIRTQYLTDTPPARLTLAAMQGSEAEMRERLQALRQQLSKSQAEVASAVAALSDSEQALADLNERYTELERLSGNSVELDRTNRSLLQSVETLSAEQETLQAENQRLLERMEYSQFTDGALAVGLGVIITLLIPRLWPQRKRNSGWS